MTWTGRQQRGVSRWILQLCDDLFLYFFLLPCFFFHFFSSHLLEASVSESQKIKMDGKTMTKCQKKKRCARESKEKEEDVARLNRKSSTLFLFASPKDIPGRPVPFFRGHQATPAYSLHLSFFLE